MNERGLTIIEVLVALVIIAVAFIALANTQILNLQVTRDSQVASIATQVANGGMEYAAQLFLGNGFSCDGIDCFGSVIVEVKGNEYAAAYEVEELPASDPKLAGTALVTVTVDTPRHLVFGQYVSCLDIDPPPSFNSPGACES